MLYRKFLVIIVLFLLSTNQQVNAQFFDFQTFDASLKRQTFPASSFGESTATIKTISFSNGDTLWAGTYKDGAFKWWYQNEFRSYWWQISTAPGKETYNLASLNSKYVFFTDFNSFNQEYNGLYRLNNKDVLVDPKSTKINFIGPDSTYPVMPMVNDIAIMGDSLVMLATDSGLVMFDGEGKWRRRNPDNVTNITNWKIDEACGLSDGGIYLASGTDIYRRIGINWEKIDLKEAPYRQRNTYIKELRTGPGDTVWAITTKAIVKIHADTSIVIQNTDIKPILNEVRDVTFDSIGNPWMIFELNGGIRFLDESTGVKVWRQINSTNSDLPDELSCIASNSKGQIWLGSDNNGLFKYESFTPGSVESIMPSYISIYPTIGNGTLTINLEVNDENFQISIFGMDGKLLQDDKLHSGLNNFQLPKGVYLIGISDENTYYTLKVIVL